MYPAFFIFLQLKRERAVGPEAIKRQMLFFLVHTNIMQILSKFNIQCDPLLNIGELDSLTNFSRKL